MSGLYTTEGIVFRAFKYGESSMIADIYTKSFGLKSFISSGIRTKKSSGKVNVFYPGNIVEITAYPASDDKLSRLKEINYAYKYDRINHSVITSSVVAFLMEICKKTVREKEVNEDLYAFLFNRLIMMDQGEIKLKFFHIKFLIELSVYLGFEPFNNYSSDQPLFDLREGVFVDQETVKTRVLNKEQSFLFSQLITLDINELNSFDIAVDKRDMILDKLLEFYHYHIESFGKVKSLEILRTILS